MDQPILFISSLDSRVSDKPKFLGSFHRWEVNFSINQERRAVARFLVFSSGKRGACLKYLWLKFLWDELTQKEFYLFLSLPEVLRNAKMQGFLRALLTIPKRELRYRLNKLEELFGEKTSNRNSYRGYKRLHLEIQAIERRLPRTPKFSGYVKSPSSVGSKNSKKILLPESISNPELYNEKEIDWYQFLTIGEIPLLGEVIHSLKSPNKDEMVSSNYLNL